VASTVFLFDACSLYSLPHSIYPFLSACTFWQLFERETWKTSSFRFFHSEFQQKWSAVIYGSDDSKQRHLTASDDVL
jgi:hypothetical protein